MVADTARYPTAASVTVFSSVIFLLFLFIPHQRFSSAVNIDCPRCCWLLYSYSLYDSFTATSFYLCFIAVWQKKEKTDKHRPCLCDLQDFIDINTISGCLFSSRYSSLSVESQSAIMLKLSQLLDAKRRDSSEAATADPSAISSRRSIQSPGNTDSSTPVSPALSLFSSKGHARVSSSVSSLVPSPGHGNSMESATRDHGLTGVQEEPCTNEARDLEQEYFRMFILTLFSDSGKKKH